MLQSRLQFVKVQDKSLNSLLASVGSNQTKYNYSVMKLALGQMDFVNNIVLKGRDLLAIILESGTIVLYSIIKNEPIAVLKTDRWSSSVYILGREVWSIGQRYQLICQNYPNHVTRFKSQEIDDHNGYFKSGSVLRPTKSNSHFVYNAGYYIIKVLNARTKKLIKKFNLKEFCPDLQDSPKVPGAIKEWYGSKLHHQIFFLAPSKDGCLFYFVVYDYKRMKELQRIEAFPRVDLSKYQVNYHLLMSSDELVVMCFFELIDVRRREISTNFSVMQRSDHQNQFMLRGWKPFREFTDQITCKTFVDEHIHCKKNKVFSISTYMGFTYTFVLVLSNLDLQPLEVLRKSNQTLTSSLIVKNLSFCSSITGEVVVFDTSSLCENRLGDDFIPWKEEEKLYLKASDN
jgi:hypothetical protein